MRSMRSVMRKPPTTLMVAQVTATKPRIWLREWWEPAARSDADERDAADGVGAAHQRRVQERRNPRNDLVADERRQDEHVQVEHPLDAHDTPPVAPVAPGPTSSFTFGWTTDPPCVMTQPRAISSLKSSFQAPSFVT